MLARELRIGNLTSMGIVYLIEDDIFRVKNNEGDSLKNTFADIKPIPLTKEWLLKFGFEEKYIGKNESWYEIKYLSNEHDPIITSWVSILINVETCSCVICDEYPEEIGANTKRKIEYVHHLQNLYFALTGEELIFKSEK